METFAPNITALFNQILSSTTDSKQMEVMPELPPAMVTLASTLLRLDSNESRLRISTSIYGSDALFQQRQSFITRTNRERERVGSIVLDISLRQNGTVTRIFRPPNSNVVRPSFTKSMVSYVHGQVTCTNTIRVYSANYQRVLPHSMYIGMVQIVSCSLYI